VCGGGKVGVFSKSIELLLSSLEEKHVFDSVGTAVIEDLVEDMNNDIKIN
jgi:hypothetical protein